MSTAATLIPTYAAITLLVGGYNELSVELTLFGTLAIILHAAMTPTDLSGPYPNFDNHPTQPPFRDYVLVFGLVSFVLAALFSRVYPFLRSLVRGQSVLKAQDTKADLDPRPIPHTPSPSQTFTGQWTATASTLAVGSIADSSETTTLKLRVSQLEAALEEMRCRIDTLTRGKQGTEETSGVVATHTPAPSPNTTVPPPTQLLSPSPSPIDQGPIPLSALSPVDAAIDARKHLRSFVELAMEETRQTDRLIREIRDILAKADATNDAAFEAPRVEDNAPPVPSTSRSTRVFREHLPSSSLATPFVPSPYPSPSPSSHTHPNQPMRTPTTRRVNTPPLPSAVNHTRDTANGPPRTAKFNLTLDLLDLSQVPCSTPLRSAKEVEKSISLSPSSFVRVLEGPSPAPAFKPAKDADTRVRPATRATSAPTRIMTQDSTPGHKRDFISRIRERSLRVLHPPPSRARVDALLDTRRNSKGKGNAARALAGISDWLTDYRRRKNTPSELRPFYQDRGTNA